MPPDNSGGIFTFKDWRHSESPSASIDAATIIFQNAKGMAPDGLRLPMQVGARNKRLTAATRLSDTFRKPVGFPVF
jgi:hypothetical protein